MHHDLEEDERLRARRGEVGFADFYILSATVYTLKIKVTCYQHRLYAKSFKRHLHHSVKVLVWCAYSAVREQEK